MKQIITLTTEQNDIFFRELGEEKAMQLIKWTIIGFIIVLFSSGIVNLIEYIIGKT